MPTETILLGEFILILYDDTSSPSPKLNICLYIVILVHVTSCSEQSAACTGPVVT